MIHQEQHKLTEAEARAQAMHFSRIRFLRRGLAGWKAEGYPVEPYEKTFHLDIRT